MGILEFQCDLSSNAPCLDLFFIARQIPFFFAAANPSIRNGGMLNESKEEVHSLIPASFAPKSLFFKKGVEPNQVTSLLKEHDMHLPLVGKPNIGARGRGVKMLRSNEELLHYIQSSNMDFHLQVLIEYPHEVGLFYCKEPGQQRGCITGIVRKEFLQVTGDGVSTLEKLVKNDNRAIVYYEMIKQMMGENFIKVYPMGEKVLLSPYGNHARGAKFINDSHLIDDNLQQSMDKVFSSIKDFYYGRLDIRFYSWEELKLGKSFSIIEVNGAGAEPTHMYDPKHSIWYAWKEITRHWHYLHKISILNHRMGYRYLTFREGIEMFKEDAFWSRQLSNMPF